jgi:hypothetical protein
MEARKPMRHLTLGSGPSWSRLLIASDASPSGGTPCAKDAVALGRTCWLFPMLRPIRRRSVKNVGTRQNETDPGRVSGTACLYEVRARQRAHCTRTVPGKAHPGSNDARPDFLGWGTAARTGPALRGLPVQAPVRCCCARVQSDSRRGDEGPGVQVLGAQGAGGNQLGGPGHQDFHDRTRHRRRKVRARQ